MSIPAIITQVNYATETPEESLYQAASNAKEYAFELMDEITPLINQMRVNHPKEAARFAGLIKELATMTDVTKNRAEKLIQ
ncbi:hypothetical protein KKI90_20485 [Xenorhabdus bovienii]|uniref:Uncharacterized protein n=2 Tax=Xenorhabdus bovienii TaxID=40576 RepID=A0A077P0F9_XENBV|nr:hypothetical protein [Xenorhabdus bovienii]MCG3462814.1 hypothetical protein [Xenorhabdus bovienii]MDE1484327.1 hypothetical protein [Xenorhabdus bovienii]MDE1487019.1 hypothetical protein [Xenorhabdus bovienii]MDE1493033.1 hypothetical protein [Xenorhabdus bovienii]MDE9447631.1 hypothetical protein [Xenorhabdus bovienii]